MERLIEKNKTYRIPRKDGTADLYQVLLIIGDSIKVKDLKKNVIKIFKKAPFQKDLNEGLIYVEACRKNTLIKALRKLAANY